LSATVVVIVIVADSDTDVDVDVDSDAGVGVDSDTDVDASAGVGVGEGYIGPVEPWAMNWTYFAHNSGSSLRNTAGQLLYEQFKTPSHTNNYELSWITQPAFPHR